MYQKEKSGCGIRNGIWSFGGGWTARIGAEGKIVCATTTAPGVGISHCLIGLDRIVATILVGVQSALERARCGGYARIFRGFRDLQSEDSVLGLDHRGNEEQNKKKETCFHRSLIGKPDLKIKTFLRGCELDDIAHGVTEIAGDAHGLGRIGRLGLKIFHRHHMLKIEIVVGLSEDYFASGFVD